MDYCGVGGGGGGGQRVCWFPSQIIEGGGAGPPGPPLPTPMISSHSSISILYPFTVLSGNIAHLRYLINEIG